MGSWQGFHWMIVSVIFLLPAILVLFSSKVSGYEKLGWTLVSLFLCWFGFMVFLIVMVNRPNARKTG